MNLKKILPLLVVVLLFIAWYTNVSSILKAPLHYNEYLKKAEKYEKEGRYQYAIEEYEKAIAYKPENLKLYEKEVEDYKKLEDVDNMISRCDYIISNFEKNENAYITKLNYYIQEEKLSDIAETVIMAHAQHPDNKKINEIYTDMKGRYYDELSTYSYIGRMRNKGALCVNEDGLFGIINNDAGIQVAAKYEYLTLYSNIEDSKNSFAAVKSEDELYYMDSNGYKALVNTDKYDFLGEISENVMVVGKNGKYGYAYWNEEERVFSEKTDLKWEYASCMMNGVAAVLKDSKWSIINSDYKEVTKDKYDDVKLDEYGMCSVGNLIFVKQGDKYKLITTEGKDVTKAVFDDAKTFVGGDYAAVCQDNKWGFVNSKGEFVIECKYDDAESFTSLYAPVMKDGKWGYIDKADTLVYDYQFEDAKQFNQNAIAPVCVDGIWKLIHAYIYE